MNQDLRGRQRLISLVQFRPWRITLESRWARGGKKKNPIPINQQSRWPHFRDLQLPRAATDTVEKECPLVAFGYWSEKHIEAASGKLKSAPLIR